MRSILAALVMLSACGDDSGGPMGTARVEHKEFPLGTLGVPCFDGQLLDTDDAMAGIQPGCSATIADEVVPACGDGRTPCFRFETHAACDMTPTMLAVVIDGQTEPGAIFVIECLLED